MTSPELFVKTGFDCIKICVYRSFFSGVLSMLELKPNELLVGSGDGSVSLVLDKSGLGGPQQKRKPDGITRQLNEPTTSCLQEVNDKAKIRLEIRN